MIHLTVYRIGRPLTIDCDKIADYHGISHSEIAIRWNNRRNEGVYKKECI